MRIATLGPKKSYSEEASRIYGKRNNVKDVQINYTTVGKALHQIEHREADVAIVPLENTVDGLIGATLDALIEHHDFVKICDEVNVEIRHVLAGPENTDMSNLDVIYSHYSALNQCAGKLGEIVPGADLVAVNSTSQAAVIVKDKEANCAAICSQEAAKTNGLTIFTKNIQDYEINITRFAVCSLIDSIPSGNDRTVVAIRPGQDKPGLLYSILSMLAAEEVNLTFIQSRPYRIRPQEYIFVFEIEGHRTNVKVEKALDSIGRFVTETYGWKRILGSYPKREVRV